MQNTAKQNYPGSVASNDIRPRNKMGLILQCFRLHMRQNNWLSSSGRTETNTVWLCDLVMQV